ncbi:MAG TPA: hypothetical protein PLP17_10975, partial [Oligoflexia bacterium]|nr:hypothetical protein [Oligoflexia bacterium]
MPNHIYHLSFYAKAEAADSCVHYPRVLAALDIPGRTAIVRTADIALGKGWQQYYLTFTYASDEPLAATAVFSIAAEITGSGKAAMWLDELQLDDLTYKLRNVLITPSTSVEVWNDAGTIRYREGVDYELMHTPGKEISLRNPMRGRETRIKRLGSAIGSRFRVSYDYAVNFQQHKNEEISFSEPRSLELYNKWLKANVDYFQPDFILVGLDELRSINRDSRSKKRGLPNYEVLSSFINQVNSSLQALRPGTRMLVWDDMLNPSHNGKIEDYQVPYGGQAGTTWPALQLIDRQVMPIVWWYRDADYHHKMRESKIFPEFGFEFIAAAGGVRLLNPDWWSYLVHTYGGSGMIMFEARGNEIPGLEQTARYAWTTRKTYGRQCYKWAIEMCDTTLTKPGRDEDCNNYEVIGGSLKTFDTYVDEDFDFQNDMLNCGYCSNHCFYANGIGACSAGKCSLDKCLNGYFDADGNPDNGCEAHDACPNDPAKTGPGACGCGVADTDSDGDSQPDCLDQCPADPAKTHPGACGCGAPENDSDGDGSADCTDLCPDDALKTEPGSCGCGIADSDSDNDTRP